MKTPADKTIMLTFQSHPANDPRMRWTMVLTFPSGSAAETRLPISVTDVDGLPIAAATLEFAGCRLPVRAGEASISYAEFVRGKHAVPLWLHRMGMPPVPGGLTFA